MAANEKVLASLIEVVTQTFVYVDSIVLVIVSTIILVKRGLQFRSSIVMLCVIWTTFALSSAHYVTDFTVLIMRVESPEADEGSILSQADLMNAIIRINYAVADAVLVWRMWVLCQDEYKRLLYLSYACLALTSVFVVACIGLRIATSSSMQLGGNAMVNTLNVLQVGTLVMSLITNVSSTGVFGAYLWKYRQFIRENLTRGHTMKSERVLILLTESGFLYTLFVMFSIIGTVIRVPIVGTLGDVTNAVLGHVSGIYPSIVITLVNIQHSVHNSTFTLPTLCIPNTPIRESYVASSQHSESLLHPVLRSAARLSTV